MSTTNGEEPKDTKAKAPKPWLVLDSTATTESGPRTHEQIIAGAKKQFTFKPGEGLAMAPAIAIKFLKHDAFKRIDENGQIVEYKRPPRQPEELGAGEQLRLSENETVARYDELSTAALLQRVAQLPGGEKFASGADKPDRAAMTAFIVAAKAEARKANLSPDRVGRDEFTPDAEEGDEELAA